MKLWDKEINWFILSVFDAISKCCLLDVLWWHQCHKATNHNKFWNSYPIGVVTYIDSICYFCPWPNKRPHSPCWSNAIHTYSDGHLTTSASVCTKLRLNTWLAPWSWSSVLSTVHLHLTQVEYTGCRTTLQASRNLITNTTAPRYWFCCSTCYLPNILHTFKFL